jgi:hypothetical protein
MIEFTIQIPELEALIRRFSEAPVIVSEEARRGMEEAVAVAHAEVDARTPVDSGRLVQNIGTEVQGSGAALTGLVFVHNIPYAPFVEFGTRGHTIEVRPARVAANRAAGKRHPALRFRAGGRGGPFVFRRRVRHPGTRAYRMFRDGAEAALPGVKSAFARALERATERIARG